MLSKKYIKKNTSSYTAPILIIKKPNKRLRVYINYKILNAFIIKNRNAFPLIYKILNRLCNVKQYSKFNVITTFNKIRIKKGNKKKTAFFTKYRLFKYIVMLFGLYNTLDTF